jgi:alkylation response protein AidB-like acyl-CoA dehydrogenase
LVIFKWWAICVRCVEAKVATDVSEVTLEEFEREVRAFLDRNVEKADGADPTVRDAASVRRAREWQRKKYEAGLGWIMGPREFGGRELSEDHERLFRRLEREFDAPSTGSLSFGLTIIGSAILAHCTPEGREKYLPRLYSGEWMACQLFSEPGAGSDLAGVQTLAVRDGDGWRITGQKVWTSEGHNADVGEAVCRTDLRAPKHQGITIFMVDMHAPGVEVRPLVDATGEAHFNEVFLNEVRVDDVDRIGPVNEGWRVLNTSLMNERAYVGENNEGGEHVLSPEQLARTLTELGLLDDPVIRDGLADLFVRFRTAAYATRQAKQQLERGETPGPEQSMHKLTYSENQERLVHFAATALGPLITAEAGDDGAYAWAISLIRGRALRIAGGTDEIQRNILGERVLRLPRDPAIDNAVPFDQIPRSVQRP